MLSEFCQTLWFTFSVAITNNVCAPELTTNGYRNGQFAFV